MEAIKRSLLLHAPSLAVFLKHRQVRLFIYLSRHPFWQSREPTALQRLCRLLELEFRLDLSWE